jgi:lactate dehydrogenase-like 2-hydroxyacid dehydrogenase
MNPEILAMIPFYEPTLVELEREFTVHKLWLASDPDLFLKEVSGSVRGAVTTGVLGFSRSQFEALPKLEILSFYGTPHGTVDLAAAKEQGVIVTYTPDSITELVAELAMGLLIAAMRRICESDRFVRAGKWPLGLFPPGSGLMGKTCGIIGLGRIGRGIARRAEAFGMSVCYYGPHQKQDVSYTYYSNLESMAHQSDCLLIACPNTPATHNLVDARILNALGPGGWLVNVARGWVVDKGALIEALRTRQIAGAGLDVFWDEPQVPTEFIGMEHVVIVPHIGSSTLEIREERGRQLLANLRAHFAGKAVLTPLEA